MELNKNALLKYNGSDNTSLSVSGRSKDVTNRSKSEHGTNSSVSRSCLCRITLVPGVSIIIILMDGEGKRIRKSKVLGNPEDYFHDARTSHNTRSITTTAIHKHLK